MGLACSQARLLTLTARKADCEYGISIDSMQKMALTREMSELSQDYYSKLQSKQISYYANGKYNKMNYAYLMGYGSNYTAIWNQDKHPMKEENSMVLTDYKGQVVLSDDYAKALTTVLGPSAMNKDGRGGTFSTDKIPAILAALCPGFTAETFKTIIDGNNLSSEYDAHGVNTLTGEENGNKITVDNSSTVTQKAQAIVDFYMPILSSAASNGWTTEYNKEMALNDDYISDALVTGSFQLATVNESGQIFKLLVGLIPILIIKSALKTPLYAIIGNEFLADGIRYFLIAIVAGFIWPMTFKYWNKLAEPKKGAENGTK